MKRRKERMSRRKDSRARLVPILQACVHLAEFYGLRGEAEVTARCHKARRQEDGRKKSSARRTQESVHAGNDNDFHPFASSSLSRGIIYIRSPILSLSLFWLFRQIT